MTQNETYAVMAAIALVAYTLGMNQAKARAATATYDPMAWLNSWTPT